jgi:hypothetical protein
MVGEPTAGAAGAEEEEAFQEYVVLDSAGRLQVPREQLDQVGIGDRVTLEVTDEGILMRPVEGRPAPGSPLVAGLEEEEAPAARRRGLRGWWARRRTG